MTGPVPALDAAPTPSASAGGGRRQAAVRMAITTIRVAAAPVVLASLIYVTVSQWHDVRTAISALSWPYLLTALALVMLGGAANMLAWRATLDGFGNQLRVGPAARVCLIGQLAKYVPGGVWEFVLQMELGRRNGVPRQAALITGPVTALLGLVSGLIVGGLGAGTLLGAARTSASGRTILYAIAALIPIALLCAAPPVLNRILAIGLRVFRRPPMEGSLTWPVVGRVLAWTGVAWVAFGLQLWALRIGAGMGPDDGPLPSISAMTLAMIAGLFAFISPSGLGAREAIMALALAPAIGDNLAQAFGIALCSRAIFGVADVLLAALAAATSLDGRRSSRRTAESSP